MIVSTHHLDGKHGYTSDEIFRSTDGGKHWNRSKAIEAWDIVYDVRNPEVLYGATADGVYRSVDGGLTWNVFFQNGNVGEVRSLGMYNDMLAIYTYQRGIYLLDVDALEASISSAQADVIITPYYDLMGREVTHPTRGIYIKDGKKVIVE